MTAKTKKSKSTKSEKKKSTIPYHKKPDNMSLDEWQIGLRRQFAGLQEFTITNLGSEAVFSGYSVYNPDIFFIQIPHSKIPYKLYGCHKIFIASINEGIFF